MPNFSFSKTYKDGVTPKARDLDNLINSIVSAVNQTKLDSTNFQANAITTATIKDEGVADSVLPSVGQQISSSSGLFSTSSTSLTDVTNLSVSITTTGSPVMLALIPDGTTSGAKIGVSGSSGSADGKLTFDRGGTDIASFNINLTPALSSTSQLSMPCGAFKFLDVVSSGTYTYKCRVKLDVGDFLLAYNCKLVAYEL